MPEMDGFEATAAIRDREKATGEHLPVIAQLQRVGISWRELHKLAFCKGLLKTRSSRIQSLASPYWSQTVVIVQLPLSRARHILAKLCQPWPSLHNFPLRV
jgi:CheY-like chemotaxis protein